MKKNYLLIAGMALLASPLASAYDASDFVGKICGQVWISNPAADWTGTDCNSGRFEAYPGDNSKVILTRLDNYTGRAGDQFVFTINGNTLTLDNANIGLYAYDAAGNEADIFTTDYQRRKTFGYTTYTDYLYNFYDEQNASWTGTITKDEANDVIRVEFYNGFGLGRMAYYDYADMVNISNRTIFYVYKPNGTMTVTKSNGSTSSCPVRVQVRAEAANQRVFGIYNFLDKGWVAKHPDQGAIEVQLEQSGVAGWLYNDGSVRLPDQKIAPKMTCTVIHLNYGGGLWLRGNTIYVSDFRLRKQQNGGDITAKYVTTSDSYTINSTNFWHKNHGGDLKMTEQGRFTLDNFVVYRDLSSAEYNKLMASYNGSTVDCELEVAPKVTVKLDKFGADKWGGVYVKGSLTDAINDKYVDDYEIYLVHGKYSKITDAGFSTHAEHGHSDAICLTGYTYSLADNAWGDAKTVTKDDMTFEARVPVEDIKAKGWDPEDQNYTLYVRFNLKPASAAASVAAKAPGMAAGVFGSMVTPAISTGVEDIVAPATATITAGAGCINIDAEVPASIYNASGALLYHGSDSSVDVAPGLYIVKAGRTVAKVVVR